MLSNADINEYKELQKETADANTEKQQMLAEIKVLKKQGLEKLGKYGFDSFSDIYRILLPSSGFSASAGIAQELPTINASGMRPSLQRI